MLHVFFGRSRLQALFAGLTCRATFVSAAAVIPNTRIVVVFLLTLTDLRCSGTSFLLEEWQQLFPEEWRTFYPSRSGSSLSFEE